MLFDDLKKENMQAMKEKNAMKRGILPVVINKVMLAGIELKASGKELKDEDVLQIISKTMKELKDEATTFKDANRMEKYEELMNQRNYLEGFLPKQLTREEIKDIISKLDDKSIPSVMKHFKANYSGKCDMKLVNELAKEA
ncbi:MAG: GatB/YqeY domain-containing protein [Anaeroplasmataceae bacterium]